MKRLETDFCWSLFFTISISDTSSLFLKVVIAFIFHCSEPEIVSKLASVPEGCNSIYIPLFGTEKVSKPLINVSFRIPSLCAINSAHI